MTDKELLEEIVEKIAEQLYDRIGVPETKVIIEYQDIKYLFSTIEEQAERAEDYETINKELHKRIKKDRKQNKRYCEALEEIAKSRITIADSYGNIRTAKRALEKEE